MSNDRFTIKKCFGSTPMSITQRPPAIHLSREFENFGGPGNDGRFPCRRDRDPGLRGNRVVNQCGVRMSVAICRAINQDIFDNFTGRNLHSTRCCAGETANKYRHLARAQDLYDYLNNGLGYNFVESTRNPSDLIESPGIIFFENCFPNERGGVGSHIDYWNGDTYTNSAAGNARADVGLGLFQDADAIFFCRLF